MSRLPRIDPPGSWHHVMNRGARHQAIFDDNPDRTAFLTLVGRVAQRYALEVHAYALMDNHFHLLVRSHRHRLSAAMRDLQQTWTRTVNRRHGWDGPLFRSRFRSQLVEDERYLHNVLAYVHLNPVRAGVVKRAADAAWTSHAAYLHGGGPEWLHTAELLAAVGGAEALDEHVNTLATLPADIGEELLEEIDVRGPLVGQTLRTPPDERTPPDPDAVLRRVQKIAGCTEKDLRRAEMGPRANPARRFAVWALRTTTELTQPEVGEVLAMSTRQVQNVELRLRNHLRPPVEGWVHAWMAGEGE